MTFKPEGLQIPDCECFRDKQGFKLRNVLIDKVVAMATQDLSDAFFALNFCDKARDYYFSAMIFQMLIGCCPQYGKHVRKGAELGRLEEHRQEIEAAYDRIRPMIMQRIEYIDGMADSMGIK
jgi:hypothetical protein